MDFTNFKWTISRNTVRHCARLPAGGPRNRPLRSCLNGVPTRSLVHMAAGRRLHSCRGAPTPLGSFVTPQRGAVSQVPYHSVHLDRDRDLERANRLSHRVTACAARRPQPHWVSHSRIEREVVMVSIRASLRISGCELELCDHLLSCLLRRDDRRIVIPARVLVVRLNVSRASLTGEPSASSVRSARVHRALGVFPRFITKADIQFTAHEFHAAFHLPFTNSFWVWMTTRSNLLPSSSDDPSYPATLPRRSLGYTN